MSRVDICKVAVMTRNELEEFVAGVRWIAYKSREIKARVKRDGILATSHPLLYSFPGFGLVWLFPLFILFYQLFGIQVFSWFP